jgi:hypothetical protein
LHWRRVPWLITGNHDSESGHDTRVCRGTRERVEWLSLALNIRMDAIPNPFSSSTQASHNLHHSREIGEE